MATLTKLIEIGDYKFELTLTSKSVHAHSLMTDYKKRLGDHISSILITLKDDVNSHKETKKL